MNLQSTSSQLKDFQEKVLNLSPSSQHWNSKVLQKLAQRLITDTSSTASESNEENCLVAFEKPCQDHEFSVKNNGKFWKKMWEQKGKFKGLIWHLTEFILEKGTKSLAIHALSEKINMDLRLKGKDEMVSIKD